MASKKYGVRQPGRVDVWSYGGGTQSAAIAVLILQGRLPLPECAVIADTSREATETWVYLEQIVQPALSGAGLTIEVASHDLAAKDLFCSNNRPLMPIFTAGGIGQMRTLCSGEWKRDVVLRYLRSKGYGPDRPVAQWFGMSSDELSRAALPRRKWASHAYPLMFDVPMRRHDCKRLVVEFGWPEPPKSSCWMCPHRSNRQWVHLRNAWPEDWEKAIELDEHLRTVDSDAYVHRSGVPLSQADIDTPEDTDFFGCSTGYCFV